jgi:hypothetical protein
LLIQDLFFFDKKLLFILNKKNKNKNNYYNTFFNFDNNLFILNNSKLYLFRYIDNFELFKIKLINFILIKNFLLKNYSFNMIKNSYSYKNNNFIKLYLLNYNNVLLFNNFKINYDFLLNINFISNINNKNFNNFF